MIKTLKKLMITLLLTVGITSAFAGGGHSHEANEYIIESNAKYELGKLINKGKFDESWKKSKKVTMKKQG